MSAISSSSLLLTEDHPLHRVQRIAIGVGGAALLVCAIAGLARPDPAPAQLPGRLPLLDRGRRSDASALLMIQHITGGAWGVAIRRLLESGARTLPVMALLFVPIALGVGHLYEWAQPEHVAHDPLLQHKALYLNVPFFLARAALLLPRLGAPGARPCRAGRCGRTRASTRSRAARLELLSRGGLVLLALTMTFAAVDWAMSLEPHWFSTIYGVIFIGGSALTAFALVIPMPALLIAACRRSAASSSPTS